MSKYFKAIKEINPNAEFTIYGTNEESLDNITWYNDTTPISKEDIIAKQAELPTEEELAAQKEALKASGNTKLLALGLTQAEATALTGYKPE